MDVNMEASSHAKLTEKKQFGSHIGEDTDFDKNRAKDIICKFFPKEWPSVDPQQLLITKIVDGFSNTLLFVDRKSGGEEPSKLTIRMPGRGSSNKEALNVTPDSEPVKMSWLEEALTCRQFGLNGWGAKLYGVFPGGRVDEFITGHTLTPADVEDPLIRSEVAKSFARFHSMQLPCDRSRCDAFDRQLLSEYQKLNGRQELISKVRSIGIDWTTIVNFDYASDIREIYKRLAAMNAKKVWCVGDSQYLNAMVRDDPQEDESKVVLFDFEITMFQYRGFDVGGHFFEKHFQWNDQTDKRSGARAFSVDEKKDFCHHYLVEKAKLDPASIDAVVDTVDHLMQEADLGFLLKILFDLFWPLYYTDQFMAGDSGILVTSNSLHEIYAEQRKRILSKTG